MSKLEKDKLLQRLTRVEGQVRGLQRMINDEKSCADILTQIAAVRAALAQVGKMIFQEHSRVCIQEALEKEGGETEAIDELLSVLNRLLK
ncbi:MAG: metal-sensitive transcriptional regulator [Bacillota bacterium]|nr:metal-sensitive transcriptional regulator [Bacillota bacterium]HHU62032.1 metal-sensitive transcriptional regulator [Natronincola sp.]